MKNLFANLLYALAALGLICGTACNSKEDDYSATDNRENALKPAVEAYVDNTIVPTYRSMADGSVELLDACETMRAAHTNGALTIKMIEAAGAAWITTRAHWELSEAFLYGAAADYDIDPHIDSWPLDVSALQTLLSNNTLMNQIHADPGALTSIVQNNYGLLGFHAIEYMLYDYTRHDATPHSTVYTVQEMSYLVGVATDLCIQCVHLEAAWAGRANISGQRKLEMLNKIQTQKLERDYGEELSNPGASRKYKNYLASAQEVIQGCLDIADEVGSQKIGRPAGTYPSDPGDPDADGVADNDYIESPYSGNSQTDFVDNIISIRRSYEGGKSGDASISDWVKTVNPALDAEARATIETAIDKIRGVSAKFETNAGDQAWKDASQYCTVELVNVLERVMSALEGI